RRNRPRAHHRAWRVDGGATTRVNLSDDSSPLDASVLSDGRTIVAIATAHGRGAIAMVRLSGPGVPAIMRELLRPSPSQPRVAVRARFAEGAGGQEIDDVVATYYEGPHSFTGEHVL